jgi:hypothetical protein
MRWGMVVLDAGGGYFAALARLAALALALASNAASRASIAAAMRCNSFGLMQSRMNDSQTSADKPMIVFLNSVLDLNPADTTRASGELQRLAVLRRDSSHAAIVAAL